jgi:ribosomal protein S18 acetylase RimI-like enzyme
MVDERCRKEGGRLNLAFECIQPTDIPELTTVMVRAFDDDAQRTFGVERGGPDGYDNGEFFRKWLFRTENSHGYKILEGDRIIGAFVVWIYADGRNVLGTIFVDPDYQNMGVGTEAWRFIEQAFPSTRSWELATPSSATKNLHFYESKCGFRKIREDETDEHPGTSLVYEKRMTAE